MTLQENLQSLIDKTAALSTDPKTIKDCVSARNTLTEISKECTSLRKQIQEHRQAKKKPRKPKLETIDETLEVVTSLDSEESNTDEPELVPLVAHVVKSPNPEFMEPQATPKPKKGRKVVAF